MKQGKLASLSIESGNAPVLLFQSSGKAVLQLSAVLKIENNEDAAFSFAVVPSGESLTDSDWMAYKQHLQFGVRYVSEKFLMDAGDRLMVRASVAGVSFVANGMVL